jgi:hypothetical protein
MASMSFSSALESMRPLILQSDGQGLQSAAIADFNRYFSPSRPNEKSIAPAYSECKATPAGIYRNLFGGAIPLRLMRSTILCMEFAKAADSLQGRGWAHPCLPLFNE